MYQAYDLLRKHGISPKTGFLAEKPLAALPRDFKTRELNVLLGKLDDTLYELETLVANRRVEKAVEALPEWEGWGFYMFSSNIV